MTESFGDWTVADDTTSDDPTQTDAAAPEWASTDVIDPLDTPDPFDTSFADEAEADTGGDVDVADALVVDGQLVGDPVGDAEHWFNQAANGYCVPSSVAQIVSEYTGQHFADEDAFVALANELHLFDVGPDGVPSMSLDGALRLLEASGVPASIDPAGTVDELVEHLDEGRRIILAVDSGEIWGTEVAGDTALEFDAADHAVVLTGIDLDRGVAILSDPGTPDGNMSEIPLDVLVDAWADADNGMVVCDTAPGEAQVAAVPGWGEDVLRPADVDSVAVDAAAPSPVGDGTPVFGGTDLDDVLPEQGPVDQAVSWVGRHPYVLLPVVLAAGAVARAAGSRR